MISFQSSAGDLQILSDVREMGVEIKALPCEIDSSEYSMFLDPCLMLFNAILVLLFW